MFRLRPRNEKRRRFYYAGRRADRSRLHNKTNSASLTGKTSSKLFPGSAAIGAVKNPADVFAARHARARGKTPRCPLPRVQHGVKNLRIRWIERDIATTRLRIMRRRCLQD